MQVELGRLDDAMEQFEISAAIHAKSSSPRSLAVSRVGQSWARFAVGDLKRAR